MNNASKETSPDSPEGGGGDEVDKEEDEGEEEKQEHGEVTLPKDPLPETKTSKKIEGFSHKPSSWNKSKANKPPF
jgi:hypothetical protein